MTLNYFCIKLDLNVLFKFRKEMVVAKAKSAFWTFPKEILCCKEEVGQSVRSKVLTKGQRRAQKLGQCRSTGEKIGQLCSQQCNTYMYIVKWNSMNSM